MTGPSPEPITSTKFESVDQAITAALNHLAERQTEQGSWLGDYGGPTQTMALRAGSPAINAGKQNEVEP